MSGKKDVITAANAEHLGAWAERAKPGDRCRYYTGDLASARSGQDNRAWQLGAMAWNLMESGRFTLVQQRPKAAPPFTFDYLIVCIKTAYQRRKQNGQESS